MSFTIRPMKIRGCREIYPRILADERGSFVKTFHRDLFAAEGLVTDFAEEYHSFSRKGVVRGLHFQLPPHEHAKIVYCLQGEVMDVVLDLRRGSPTYREFETVPLDAVKASMIYIPPGIAHGFCVTSESALMMYRVTTVYAPGHDTGVLWNSAGIPWPEEASVVSARDRELPPLAQFDSPFRYEEEGMP